MPRQPCETRVEEGGRTLDQPCGPTGVCGPFDVLWWRGSAESWIWGASTVARTPAGVLRVNALRDAFAKVHVATPRSMVEQYSRIAVAASCLMTVLAHEGAQVRPPPAVPPPVAPPPQPPDPGWTWPSLPGLPGFPSLPTFPQFDPNLLLIAALLFAGGWLTGEIFEEIY